jgi:phosphatidate cytidylyltransferase
VSNTSTRIITAALTIPAIVLLAYLGGYFWFAFCAAVYVVATLEFEKILAAKGSLLQRISAMAGGLLLISVFMNERLRADIPGIVGALPYPLQWQYFIWTSLLLVLIILIVELFRNKGSAILNLGGTLLTLMYLGLFIGCIVGIREIFTVAEFPVGEFFATAQLTGSQLSQLHAWGGFTMMSIVATIWICDTAAYFGGKAMGKRKLFERVSPKKTWAGAVWGLVGAIGGMLAAKYLYLDYLSVQHACAIGLFIGVFGQLGDLVESLLKRDSDVKDSSTLIPGHGGVFDRFDSLIFVSPILFLYFDFVVFA